MNGLVITDAGIQAGANAQAGGFKIDIEYFKIGNGIIPAQREDTGLSGTELYAGSIDIIEIIDHGVAIFTLELPVGSPITGNYEATEVALYMNEGPMFARGVFNSLITKESNIALRIYAFLFASAECDLTTINVTIGTHVSIPSVASVRTLPAPNVGHHNVYSVLDLKHNADGSNAASLAVRYGPSFLRWSYVGWDRIYSDLPTEILATEAQTFRINWPSETNDFADGQLFIGQIVVGPGQGESRKIVFDGNQQAFVVQEQEYTAFTTGSEIALWRVGEGFGIITPDSACPYPPDLTDVPFDWVLTRGVGCPIWAPPQLGPGASGISPEPGDLSVQVVYFTGNGRTRTYDTGFMLATGLVWVSLDGITQHTDAYDLQETKVVFSESVPSGVNIEIIVYLRTPSDGTMWKFHVEQYVTDGSNRLYLMTGSTTDIRPANQKFVQIFLSGIKQFWSSYTLYEKASGEMYVLFNEAPPPALDLQITWITVESKIGYSVGLVVNTFVGTGNSETYNLSVSPESRSNLFVSISGVELHNISSNFTLNSNMLTIPAAITRGLPIQVLIFTNTLSEGSLNTKLAGVVTGAISSHTYIKLLRYGAPDVHIPFQKVNIEPMDGIDVVGEYPNFRIKNTYAPKPRPQRLTPVRYTTLHTMNDAEEIIYAYKFAYNDDVTVTVTADFSCRLGPGFYSEDGYEYVEYVLGFKTLTSNEPPYGRRIKGTGMAGFSFLANGQYAYSNASITQTYDLLIENTKVKNVTFVSKMRIKNASVSKYRSLLDINFSLLAIPKYGD